MNIAVKLLVIVFLTISTLFHRKRLENKPKSGEGSKGIEKQESTIEDKQDRNFKLPLEAYKLLVSQLQQEESLSWRRIEVFLVINGGMIGILGLLRSAEIKTPTLKPISLGICVFGFVMCILWLLIVRRSEAFYNHWYEQLKFLEKEYLSPINIFQVADEYFTTGHIQLGQDKFKLAFLPRLIRIYHALIVVLLIFMGVWLILGICLI